MAYVIQFEVKQGSHDACVEVRLTTTTSSRVPYENVARHVLELSLKDALLLGNRLAQQGIDQVIRGAENLEVV